MSLTNVKQELTEQKDQSLDYRVENASLTAIGESVLKHKGTEG
jgi:hypothetical protein